MRRRIGIFDPRGNCHARVRAGAIHPQPPPPHSQPEHLHELRVPCCICESVSYHSLSFANLQVLINRTPIVFIIANASIAFKIQVSDAGPNAKYRTVVALRINVFPRGEHFYLQKHFLFILYNEKFLFIISLKFSHFNKSFDLLFNCHRVAKSRDSSCSVSHNSTIIIKFSVIVIVNKYCWLFSFSLI